MASVEFASPACDCSDRTSVINITLWYPLEHGRCLFRILVGTSFLGCIDSSVHAGEVEQKKFMGKALGLFISVITTVTRYLDVEGRTVYHE